MEIHTIRLMKALAIGIALLILLLSFISVVNAKAIKTSEKISIKDMPWPPFLEWLRKHPILWFIFAYFIYPNLYHSALVLFLIFYWLWKIFLHVQIF